MSTCELLGKPNKIEGKWLASRPGEEEILPAALCCRNRHKLRQLWASLGSKASLKGGCRSIPSHESVCFKIRHSDLCRKICITSLQVAISFSLVLLLHIYLWERKINVVENLYPYHVVLRTKAKDQQLRRSVKKKLSYTAWRICSHALCHVAHNILFSCQQQLFLCISKKQCTFLSFFLGILAALKNSHETHSVG